MLQLVGLRTAVQYGSSRVTEEAPKVCVAPTWLPPPSEELRSQEEAIIVDIETFI